MTFHRALAVFVVVALPVAVWVAVVRIVHPDPPPRSDSGDVDLRVAWPYRPRQGYPSVPAWLLVLLLILGVGLLLGLYGLLEAARGAPPV